MKLALYITNKLHHRKCFVRILFTRCKTLENHSFATLTRLFLKFCDSWIKIRMAHFLWSKLFLPRVRYRFFAWNLTRNSLVSQWIVLYIMNCSRGNDGLGLHERKFFGLSNHCWGFAWCFRCLCNSTYWNCRLILRKLFKLLTRSSLSSSARMFKIISSIYW